MSTALTVGMCTGHLGLGCQSAAAFFSVRDGWLTPAALSRFLWVFCKTRAPFETVTDRERLQRRMLLRPQPGVWAACWASSRVPHSYYPAPFLFKSFKVFFLGRVGGDAGITHALGPTMHCSLHVYFKA